MNGSRRFCTVRICWTTSANVCGLVVCCLIKFKRLIDLLLWTYSWNILSTYEFPEADSSLDSLEFCSDDWFWFADVELDELVVEFADVLLLDDDDEFRLALGLWLTPMTRTVGLPKAVAFISIVGAVAAPKTNGMVACVVPLTESTVIFGSPF